MDIQILKLTEDELQKKGVFNWPIWTKEESQFDWYYDENESCYFLEGEVIVEANNKSYSIKKGDFVIFPEGLKCRWIIKKGVKKHYNFG